MNPLLESTHKSEAAVVLVLNPCHRENIFRTYPYTVGLGLTPVEVNDGLNYAHRLFTFDSLRVHALLTVSSLGPHRRLRKRARSLGRQIFETLPTARRTATATSKAPE
jgi:hypothetical protein